MTKHRDNMNGPVKLKCKKFLLGMMELRHGLHFLYSLSQLAMATFPHKPVVYGKVAETEVCSEQCRTRKPRCSRNEKGMAPEKSASMRLYCELLYKSKESGELRSPLSQKS